MIKHWFDSSIRLQLALSVIESQSALNREIVGASPTVPANLRSSKFMFAAFFVIQSVSNKVPIFRFSEIAIRLLPILYQTIVLDNRAQLKFLQI